MRIILNRGNGPAGLAVPLMVLAGVVGVAACSSTGPSSTPGGSGRVRVVAAENFWGSIARQVAGGDAEVTSIISNPDADPHDYEPTSHDARTIASAQLVIENGIGYDPWAQQLLAVDQGPHRTVLDVGSVVGVPDGGNPHQWYSRASVEKVIARVVADLETVDPTHRADYERNARSYESKGLEEYSSLIARIRQQYAGTPIGASESIVAPLAETVGLKLLTPEPFLDAIAEGNEPTAHDKATTDAQIRDHRISVFVYNSQNSTPDVQRLVDAARAARIPVATVTETLTPASATFQSWQVRQLRALLHALDEARAR